MRYSPYSLQTILPSIRSIPDEDSLSTDAISPSPSNAASSPPTSFFARRSPPQDKGIASRILSGNSNLSSTHLTIDAVEAWDTHLYLGTSDGHLLRYTLEEHPNQSSTLHTSLFEGKINLGFGRRSVERILVIPQVSKAVVLCDSTLSFYSLPFFDPIPVSLIPHIKGVTCFCHDLAQEGRIGEDGTIELCVIKRRVVQIYKIGELVQLHKELPLHDGAILVTRHSRNLCLADPHQYKLINLEHPTVIPLIPIPSSPITSQPSLRPIVTVVKEDEFLVVSGSVNNQTTIGIFVNHLGDAIRGTLQWSSYPMALCVEFPYIAALLRNHTIEIHNILDQQCVQNIQINPTFEPRGMSFGHGVPIWLDGLVTRLRQRPWPMANVLSEDQDSALIRQVSRYAKVPARILIYGTEGVMAQIVTPLVVQVDGLLDNHQVELALETADQARQTMSSDTTSLHTQRLQCELDYIYQKAGILLLQETVFDDAFGLLAKGNIDPRVVVQLFSSLGRHEWLQEEPHILVFDGLRTLLDSLGRIEDIVAKNMERNYSPHVEEDDKEPSPTMNLRRVLLKNARDALHKYLMQERRAYANQINGITKAIDTVLLKLAIENNDDDALFQLLKGNNNCCTEDSVKALSRAKKYYALSILYESKHMYEQVLSTWTRIYTDEWPDRTFTDGANRIKKLLLSNINPELLPMSVLLHYAWWFMDHVAGDGVDIFIQSPRARDMDSNDILENLNRYGDDAVRTYLEYLVLTRQSDQPEHHTRLACSYIHNVARLTHTSKNLQQLVDKYQNSIDPLQTDNVDANKRTFVGFLGSQQPSPLVRSRLLLIRLLERSKLYAPQVVLQELEKAGPLLIEKVLVYGRMKLHEEALSILILSLGDFVGAETYCVTNGQSTGVVPEIHDDQTSSLPPPLPKKSHEIEKDIPNDEEIATFESERRNLFSLLLKTYLAIKDNELMFARTMHLLVTQGYYLDILDVIELIPDDWPIQTLEKFLIRSLRRSLSAHLESKVVVSMSRGENLLVGSELVKLYKDIGPVYVDKQTVCRKCNRYLDGGVVVRSHKQGQLLHASCAKKLGLIE